MNGGGLKDASGRRVPAFSVPLAALPQAVSAICFMISDTAVFVVICDSPMEAREGISTEGWSGVVPGSLRCNADFTGGRVEGDRIIMWATRGAIRKEEPWISFTNPGGDVKGANGVPLAPFDKLPVAPA